MSRETVRVMWTGGLDSTCRMFQLSLLNLTIEPIYYNNPERLSRKYEIETIQKMLKVLRKKESTQAEILDIKFLDINTLFPLDDDIVEAYKGIGDKMDIAPQYA